MGANVKVENYLPGHYLMRDISRESNGATGPSCYTDGSFPNGQFNHRFLPRTVATSHPGCDMGVMKQTIIQQDAVFKDQVVDLHRLHRVQSDMMNEARRNWLLKRRAPYETSSSSSPLPAQMQSDDTHRWNVSSFPLANPGADAVQSSLDSANGKSIWAGPSPFHNSYVPNNSEVSESRPTKVRKEIGDFRLLADECIDTDEVGRKRASANGNMFLNDPGNMERPGNARGFDLNISKCNELADLNEPLHEENPAFSSVGFLRHTGDHSGVQYRDLPARLSSSSKDTPQTSNKGSLNGTLNNLHDTRGNGQDWFRYALESEQYKANARFFNQETHPEKATMPSQPVHTRLDQACQPPPFLTSQHITREPTPGFHPLSYSMSNSNFVQQPIPGFYPSSQPGLFHPSHLGKSWDQPATYWGNPNFSGQKPITLYPSPSPFLSTVDVSKSAQPSTQNNDFFGKWSLNNNSGANGYSQGSSAAFYKQPAHFPPSDYDYVKGNSSENTSCKGNNFLKAIGCNDANPRKELNLNATQRLNGFSEDYSNPQIIKTVDNDSKPADPLAVLPWLRGKDGCNNGSGSSSEVGNKAKTSDSSLKILGVSIFENPPMPKDPPFVEIERRKGKAVFDMNMPCEVSDSEVDKLPIDEAPVTHKKEAKIESFPNYFDLNSCITEEEETPYVKIGTGIDLEALINLENKDDVILPVHDGDGVHGESAALALVAISSSVSEKTCLLPPEDEGDDPLQWFVGIACSTANDVDTQMVGNDGIPEELDDFESMVLRQKECSPDEYLPKPIIPDFPSIDNGTSTLTTRARKGKGHRGRQKFDFQRDVLPGLVTLSRHEVSGDLQVFTTAMKAAGLSWEPGHTRWNAGRNGRGRGRRRSVAAPPPLSDAVCDRPLKQQKVESKNAQVDVAGKSLTTGWGKTTRRPRRQRCPPAGNPVLPVTLA